MQTHTPPPRLPPAYHTIWQTLSEAGRRLGSRQSLARRLHVSTHTLQRLLTRGDVPLFPQTTNPRVVRAWVRTITRLAVGLGHEPRDWIESVGIPWDDTTARVSEAATPGRIRVTRRTGPTGSSPALAHGPTVVAGPEAWPVAVAAAVVDCPPFSTPLPGTSDSFLLAFARRLIGAIRPTTRIDTKLIPEDQAIPGVGQDSDACDLSLGVVDTVERRGRGLRALPIPGLRTRLTALIIHAGGGQTTTPTWRELLSRGDRSNQHMLVSRNGVAMHYLLGQCGLAPDKLLARSPAPPDRLADVFLQETQRRGKDPVILVCREEVARLVTGALQRSEGFGDELAVSELEGAPEQCPTYPLAIALGPQMAQWLDLIRAARDEALFASDWRMTALLYAELAAGDVLSSGPIDKDDPGGARPSQVLVDFQQGTVEFQNELCHHLLDTLSGEIRAQLEARREITSSQALRARADGLAALYARRVLPDTWRPTLDAVLGLPTARPQPLPGGPQVHRHAPAPVLRCRSCSVSLLDEDHRGVSDRYCRFCADEHGHLRPRHEVQALIARWFRHWQADLAEDEAMRRADLYMQALPAWSDN